ncbi:inadl protein [Roseibium alexandrii]|uniref:inadl protein n=1 Tax=Roseibium alexandrii TaxID=388408 RepID=UPI003750FCB3
MIRFAFAALMALVLFPLPALAQTTVDFSPVIDQVISGVFAVVSFGVLWLGRQAIGAFQERTGIEIDEQFARRLDDALWKAVDFGRTKAYETAKKRSEINVRNEAIGNALNYAMDAVPDTLNYFDIDQARLVDMIEARLGIDLDEDGDIGGAPTTGPNIKPAS